MTDIGTAMVFHLVTGPRGGDPRVTLVDIDVGVGRWPRRAVPDRGARIWRADQHEPEVAVMTVGDGVSQALEDRGLSLGDLYVELAELPHWARLNRMARGTATSASLSSGGSRS